MVIGLTTSISRKLAGTAYASSSVCFFTCNRLVASAVPSLSTIMFGRCDMATVRERGGCNVVVVLALIASLQQIFYNWRYCWTISQGNGTQCGLQQTQRTERGRGDTGHFLFHTLTTHTQPQMFQIQHRTEAPSHNAANAPTSTKRAWRF